MALPEFGEEDAEDFSLDVLIGHLEHLIAFEEDACERSRSKHRHARLDRAFDALQALSEVAEWTPKLTKFHNSRRQYKPVVSKKSSLTLMEIFANET